jgi:DNA adenine methylase
VLKPFLKWAGGKRQLLPEIEKYLPPDIKSRVYYEPFAGAGALFFELRPERAVINDFNAELMMSYRALKEEPDELIRLLKNHREKHCADYYYEIRGLDRDKTEYASLSNVQKAARLIYLNKTGYNGLYRVNTSGAFNVPLGKYKNPKVFDEELLRAIHGYLSSIDIEIISGDFEAGVKKADSRSFVYFDPPYHRLGTANFTSYQAEGFGEKDQIRLRDLFLALTDRGVPCLLSNADTPFIRDIYQNKGIEVITVRARRAINSDKGGRGTVNEVLIKNWSNT